MNAFNLMRNNMCILYSSNRHHIDTCCCCLEEIFPLLLMHYSQWVGLQHVLSLLNFLHTRIHVFMSCSTLECTLRVLSSAHVSASAAEQLASHTHHTSPASCCCRHVHVGFLISVLGQRLALTPNLTPFLKSAPSKYLGACINYCVGKLYPGN